MIGYESYFFELRDYVIKITNLPSSSVRPPYPFCHVPPSFNRPLLCTINLISPIQVASEDIIILRDRYGAQYEVENEDCNITASISTYGEDSDHNIEQIIEEIDSLTDKGIGCIRRSDIRDFFPEKDRRQVDIELHVRIKHSKLSERLSTKERNKRVNAFNDKIYNLVVSEV